MLVEECNVDDDNDDELESVVRKLQALGKVLPPVQGRLHALELRHGLGRGRALLLLLEQQQELERGRVGRLGLEREQVAVQRRVGQRVLAGARRKVLRRVAERRRVSQLDREQRSLCQMLF